MVRFRQPKDLKFSALGHQAVARLRLFAALRLEVE
jgi:hypothetical protein